MAPENTEILPDEARLALAHTPPVMRGPLRIFLELDMRLGRIVAGTSEPMLGQMRLAWWRETLGKPVEERPRGDVVLDGIGEHWSGREAALLPLIDAWEHVLDSGTLAKADAQAFVTKRGNTLALAVENEGAASKAVDAIKAAASLWSCADLAANVSASQERDLLVDIGLSSEAPRHALPRHCRGLAVLGALGHRALKRGGRPLMEGRTASLVATRAAIFGR